MEVPQLILQTLHQVIPELKETSDKTLKSSLQREDFIPALMAKLIIPILTGIIYHSCMDCKNNLANKPGKAQISLPGCTHFVNVTAFISDFYDFRPARRVKWHAVFIGQSVSR